MLEKLFVIISDNGIYGIYTNLDIAKETLRDICNKTSEENKSENNTSEDNKSENNTSEDNKSENNTSEDNKSDDNTNTFEDIKSYRINVYHLDENEYKLTMAYYTYKFNSFWINDDWMTTEPGYKMQL
jgi:cobalamin biosynthesis protein CobT